MDGTVLTGAVAVDPNSLGSLSFIACTMCLNVFTCFRNDDGSVYRLLHDGNLQKYGFSVEWVRVCLKRSDEFEYALLHPST